MKRMATISTLLEGGPAMPTSLLRTDSNGATLLRTAALNHGPVLAESRAASNADSLLTLYVMYEWISGRDYTERCNPCAYNPVLPSSVPVYNSFLCAIYKSLVGACGSPDEEGNAQGVCCMCVSEQEQVEGLYS